MRGSSNNGGPEPGDISEQYYKRLFTKKNAHIEALKAQVQTAEREEQQLHKETKESETRLARLKAELEKLQPKQAKETLQEFFIKEVKLKKGKRK